MRDYYRRLKANSCERLGKAEKIVMGSVIAVLIIGLMVPILTFIFLIDH